MRTKGIKIIALLFVIVSCVTAKQIPYNIHIKTGAEQTEKYFPLLKGKTIIVVANQTSTIGQSHLVDSLLKAGMKIKAVFAPEHGFRGNADAGEHVNNSTDKKTGIPIISLYGDHKKPTKEDLKGCDIVVFDIQDVGARFYTYISTMHYVMEACAENNITFLILDRPNPNGFYVDGPVLEKQYTSFVGMHPVPIVHGMTIAEYAQMINGEHWLKNGIQCNLVCIELKNYTHSDFYNLPIPPSPNLPNNTAIYLYPSLCLFEGTTVSMGRGTDKPFQIIGHPQFTKGNYKFTPRSIKGASKNPPYEGIECSGYDLSSKAEQVIKSKQINIDWLKDFYKHTPDSAKFFNPFFFKLSADSLLKKQIVQNVSTDSIRKTWANGIKKFKVVRKKYLLYTDFE
jgi:uncharacterized protein YbbC (DUF1343 family)